MDHGHPVRLRVPAPLVVADGHQRDLGELRDELGQAGQIEPPMQRAHHRGRAVTGELESVRLEVRVDDIEPLALAPHAGPGELEEGLRILRGVRTAPQGPVDGGDELALDARIAGREQRDRMTPSMQSSSQDLDDAFRSRVGARWNRQERRSDQCDAHRPCWRRHRYPGYVPPVWPYRPLICAGRHCSSWRPSAPYARALARPHVGRASEPPSVRWGLGRLESGGLTGCLWALMVGRLELRHSAARAE